MGFEFNKDWLGAYPSPTDFRDYRLARLTNVELGHAEEFMPDFIPDPKWRYQGMIGACVGLAVKVLRELQQYKENGIYKSLSSGYQYANRLLEHHQGEGWYVREALEMAKLQGSILNADFGLLTFYSQLKDLITDEMKELGKQRRIEKYAQIYNKNEIMTAIEKFGGVIVTFPVTDSYKYNDGVIEKPEGEAIEGYHATLLVGWKGNKEGEDLYWYQLNWWGSNWGANGDAWIAEDFPFIEYWTATDLPDEEADPNLEHYYIIPIDGDEIIDTEHGDIIKTDVPAQIVDGRTVLPIRIVAELLGFRVAYDKNTRSVFIPKK